MIVTDEWVWLHFPKCGGNTVDRLLRKAFAENDRVAFDALTDPTFVHHNIRARQAVAPDFQLGNRKIIVNIRRLPEWLISWVHFARTTKKPTFTPREVYERGCVMLANGKEQKADAFVRRYADPRVDHWVRVESIPQDLGAATGVAFPTQAVHANKTKLDYVRDVDFWFSKPQLQALYAACPLWAEVEREVYGSTLAD